ncbi:MAG: hypothetical protein N3H30_01270 [Candidatus Micrarchaeota archaeon]|nr:hypothetical protein [Candidatus Micrarchaeota archaeon]
MGKFRCIQGPKIKRDGLGNPVSIFEKYLADDGAKFSLRTQKTRGGDYTHKLEYTYPDGNKKVWVGDLIMLLTLPQANEEIRSALHAHEKALMPKKR